MQKKSRSFLSVLLCICMAVTLMPVLAYADDGDDNTGAVHVYAPTGDDPATGTNESPDVMSSKYEVNANGTAVPAIQYIARGHEMDIARFASEDRTPELVIALKDATEINSVKVYPERYYPAESLRVSPDKKTLTFVMSDKLPYAIVYINGTPANGSGKPYLTLINDPPEVGTAKPNPNADNVLNFKEFAAAYLLAHPITDTVGAISVPSSTIQDYSKNDSELMTWTHRDGQFVDYNSSQVQFPNLRARQPNDVSEALEAALETIKNDPALNTLYIPAGTYLWSGLRIIDWNSKPLTVYTEDGALLKNRLQECREALEPAIYIKNSSYVTISGRGVYDGQGSFTVSKDNKDARNSPHQGGSMVLHSNHIVFNDTYVRDVKQWNWECHTVEDVTYNNIKGLSPYNHAWVDGLDLTSGKNVTVNGAITLGNDDTFATGHYNPSDEFPRRIFSENRTAEQTPEVMAAAYYYNGDRLTWDSADTENIVVKDTLGWTIGAGNGMRFGHNTWGHQLKSYRFENFNALGWDGRFGITVQNNTGTYPSYDDLSFVNCSFDTSKGNGTNFQIRGSNGDRIANVELLDCWFSTSRASNVQYATNLAVRRLYIAGEKVTEEATARISLTGVTNFSNDFGRNSAPAFDPIGDVEVYEGDPVSFTVTASDEDDDAIVLSADGVLPDGAVFDPQTGVFGWTPTAEQIGVYNFTFKADDSYSVTSATVKVTVLPLLSATVNIYTNGDASTSTWNATEQNNNYGDNPYMRTMKMTNANNNANYGQFGELYSGSGGSGNDGKIGFVQFDLGEYVPDDIISAELILTYHGRARATYTGTDTIKVAALPSAFIEGNGSSVGSSYSASTIPDAITYLNRPAFDTRTTLVKESNAFQVDRLGQITLDTSYRNTHGVDGAQVITDVTEFVAALDSDNMQLSLAFCETKNFDLAFVSKEGAVRNQNADVTMQPTLKVTVKAGPSIADLNDLVDEYSETSATAYTPGSWGNFASALETAQSVIELSDPTSSQVMQAYSELLSAFKALKLRSSVAQNDILKAHIAVYSQYESVQSLYTSASYTVFAGAMTDARAIAADFENASAEEVDQAIAALNQAVEQLEKVVNTTVLTQLIAGAESILEDSDAYTPSSIAALTEALNDAKTLLASGDYTEEDIMDAASKLLEAISGVVDKGDKTNLKILIDAVKGQQEGAYTPQTWTVFRAALTAAQTVYDDPDATQDDVEKAYSDLLEGFMQLILRADKGALKSSIDLAQMIADNISAYAPATVEGLSNVLDVAKLVYADPNATQGQVDNAQAALMEKVKQARLKAVKTQLRTMVNTVRGLDLGRYETSGVVALRGLLNRADNVLADENAFQEDVDRITDDITDRLALLVLNVLPSDPGNAVSESAPAQGSNGSAGIADAAGVAADWANAPDSVSDTSQIDGSPIPLDGADVAEGIADLPIPLTPTTAGSDANNGMLIALIVLSGLLALTTATNIFFLYQRRKERAQMK